MAGVEAGDARNSEGDDDGDCDDRDAGDRGKEDGPGSPQARGGGPERSVVGGVFGGVGSRPGSLMDPVKDPLPSQP